MEVTTKELRVKPGRIINEVTNGQEITITYRGKALARIVPIKERWNIEDEEDSQPLFGMWKDDEEKKDVNEYVRNLRKGRKF
ncbi:MAG: type II toxin-antitoxin system prevent-host-death family antitoxin [Spirochaetaceae bacterium]|nr:type II toxin-antitoxin system prevent-host-death family antitoxin [Spirochaetaceae bacterium]